MSAVLHFSLGFDVYRLSPILEAMNPLRPDIRGLTAHSSLAAMLPTAWLPSSATCGFQCHTIQSFVMVGNHHPGLSPMCCGVWIVPQGSANWSTSLSRQSVQQTVIATDFHAFVLCTLASVQSARGLHNPVNYSCSVLLSPCGFFVGRTITG